MKKEVIDLRPRHDARAQELGFSDRHGLRKAANEIADTMTAQEYIDLSHDEMERLLKIKAKEMKNQ